MSIALADKAYRAPTTTYTYRQIDEASNNIANYLRDAGIQNGDAVMIFAHRSVELVCAYMGTLAAGGIVTVLDPQYPPQRQQSMINPGRELERQSANASHQSIFKSLSPRRLSPFARLRRRAGKR